MQFFFNVTKMILFFFSLFPWRKKNGESFHPKKIIFKKFRPWAAAECSRRATCAFLRVPRTPCRCRVIHHFLLLFFYLYLYLFFLYSFVQVADAASESKHVFFLCWTEYAQVCVCVPRLPQVFRSCKSQEPQFDSLSLSLSELSVF